MFKKIENERKTETDAREFLKCCINLANFIENDAVQTNACNHSNTYLLCDAFYIAYENLIEKCS